MIPRLHRATRKVMAAIMLTTLVATLAIAVTLAAGPVRDLVQRVLG